MLIPLKKLGFKKWHCSYSIERARKNNACFQKDNDTTWISQIRHAHPWCTQIFPRTKAGPDNAA